MKLKEKLQHLLVIHDFFPKSYLSQNFLIAPNIILRIVEEIEIGKKDLVLEIGAGTGILTSHLVKKAKKVWAVEVDEKLCRILREEMGKAENLEIICKDIKQVDLDKLFSGRGKIKVVGNLPYHIASRLILHLIRKKWWKVMIFTIQREVAERLLSPPGDKKRGVLTVITSYYADVEKVIDIPPQAFYPPPRVSSTVIRLRPGKRLKAKNEDFLIATVKAGFASRRKTLLNCFSRELKLPRNLIEDVLIKSEIPEKARAEELKVEDFVRLSNLLLDEELARKALEDRVVSQRY